MDVLRLGEALGSRRARVAVVGCGGAGCNSLKFVDQRLGIATYALNASADKLKRAIAAHKLAVPENDMGAAVETDPRIRLSDHVHTAGVLREHLKLADCCFSIVGLGGEKGWRCAALASTSAREAGILAVIVAILPFSVEARERRDAAGEQLAKLRGMCDGVVVVPNDRITQIAPKVPFTKAMEVVSELALLAPHELALSLGADDIIHVKRAFSAANLLHADVAISKGEDRGFKLSKSFAESQWLSLKSKDVVSGVLLVSGDKGHWEVVSAAQEFRNSFPGMRVLAFGGGSGAPKDPKILRACAIIGTK